MICELYLQIDMKAYNIIKLSILKHLNYLKHFCFLLLLFTESIKAQDIYIKGKYVEIGIHPAFSFGSSQMPPANLNLHTRSNSNNLGFVCDYDKDGWTTGSPAYMGDYFTPGDPVEGWGIQWNDTINKRNFPISDYEPRWDIVNSRFIQTAHESEIGAIWEANTDNGNNQKLSIEHILTLDTNSTFFTVTINIKNIGLEKLSNLKYWRSLDPDNEQPLTGDYTTINKIVKQVGYNGNNDTALVEARGPVHNIPLFLGAIDSRAKVSRAYFINFNPKDILDNANAPDTGYLADRSINIAFELGDIDVGECKIFTFFYGLSDRDINKLEIPLKNDFSLNQNIIAAKEICADSLVTFYDFSSGPGSQYIAKNEWDFDNDGVYDRTGDSVTWVYESFGQHLVNKRITLCNNAVHDTAIYVKINPSVKAQFDVFDSTFCRNIDTVIFINKSTSKASLSNRWTLENGSILTTDHILRRFSIDSIYSVKLFSYNDSGCMDSTTFSDTSIVHHVPEVRFSIKDSSRCTNEPFYFTNLSSIALGGMINTWEIGSILEEEDSFHLSNIIIAQADTLNVKLVHESDFGCSDSISKKIIILPTPKAGFTYSANRLCSKNNAIVFEDTSKGNDQITHIEWDWGDGSIDTGQSITKSYASADTFSILHSVLNSYGCQDTGNLEIIIDSMSLANFSINDANQCENENSYTFTNLSSAHYHPFESRWLIGDSAITDSTNIAGFNFTKADSVIIELTISNSNGCKDTMSQLAIILPSPRVHFTINKDSQCFNNQNFELTNTSTLKYGGAKQVWKYETFEDTGMTTTLKKYNSDGDYAIRLVVLSDSNCADSLEREIFINPEPILGFSINDSAQCLAGNSFSFTNTTQFKNDPAILSRWTAEDLSSLNATDWLQKSFTKDDTFNITLHIETRLGCIDSIIKEVILHPNPQSSFTINQDTQCFARQSFDFTNTSVVKNNKPMTYFWDLGDASNSASTHVSAQQYLTTGNFRVFLEAKSDLNCIDTLSKVISVLKTPVARFAIRDSSQCLHGNLFFMDNLSTADIGNVTSVWDLHDGTTYTSDSIGNKSFDRDGSYPIQLIVEDDYTCKDTFENYVIVHPHPVAIIQANNTCINEPFKISAASIIKNTSIIKTTWDFGDGTQASTSNPVKYFSSAGEYNVRLTEESNQGCKHDTSQMVTVWAKPNAQFSSTKFRSTVQDVEYQYSDQSTTDIDWWLWKFGDGQTSTLENPLITYSDTGTYFTQLIVRNTNGCIDSSIAGPVLIAPDFFLHIPNTFSPNGDGRNETFGPVMSPYFISYTMVIYNQWGEKIFENKDGSFWDGVYMNKRVPQGTYVFSLYAVDIFGKSHTRKGSLYVLR